MTTSELDAMRRQAILPALAGFLGVVFAVAPLGLAVAFRERALHYTGFVVGAALIVGALAVRAHARATWREWKASRPTGETTRTS